MKAPSKDIMNSMTRSILTLASYDPLVAKAGIDNNIRQCLSLVAIFPMLAVYGYHAYNHYENDQSMYIHRPDPKLSTAENFLRMLRADNQYTELEARVLDMALILHMEHGGGNNSTFTTRVVTSAGTDTYSAIAAAMSSLKGPKHGGANIKVMEMMRDIRSNVKHWDDEDEVRAYLRKLWMVRCLTTRDSSMEWDMRCIHFLTRGSVYSEAMWRSFQLQRREIMR